MIKQALTGFAAIQQYLQKEYNSRILLLNYYND